MCVFVSLLSLSRPVKMREGGEEGGERGCLSPSTPKPKCHVSMHVLFFSARRKVRSEGREERERERERADEEAREEGEARGGLEGIHSQCVKSHSSS